VARPADGVEDEDGEEGSTYSGEDDMPTPKMQVNHKSTNSSSLAQNIATGAERVSETH